MPTEKLATNRISTNRIMDVIGCDVNFANFAQKLLPPNLEKAEEWLKRVANALNAMSDGAREEIMKNPRGRVLFLVGPQKSLELYNAAGERFDEIASRLDNFVLSDIFVKNPDFFIGIVGVSEEWTADILDILKENESVRKTALSHKKEFLNIIKYANENGKNARKAIKNLGFFGKDYCLDQLQRNEITVEAAVDSLLKK